jgi:hypothetical protein
MKKVRFTYWLGGSIELVIKASVDGMRVVILECFEASNAKPFDFHGISVQEQDWPFINVSLDVLFMTLADKAAKE